MDLFIPIRFRTSIQLAPNELQDDFTSTVLVKLKSNLEGVCSRFGYIRPNSIEIVRRSAGHFVKQHFNGHICYDVVCKAEVCNPPQGAIFKAIVRNKNAMGLLAESTIDGDTPVLDVIVPKRAAGINSEVDIENVQIGDEIYIAVQGKRYQLNDKKISVIGKAVPQPSSTIVAPITEIVAADDMPDDDLDDDAISIESGDEEEKEASDDESAKDIPIRSVVIDDEEDDEEVVGEVDDDLDEDDLEDVEEDGFEDEEGFEYEEVI